MKTKKSKRKLFEVTFELPETLTEIHPAYTKREARKLFYEAHHLILDEALKDSIVIKELSKEEFEEKYGWVDGEK